MTTLHIVSSLDKLELATSLMQNGDHLLLVAQAAYLALPEHPQQALLSNIASYSFLDDDLKARGISAQANNRVISMTQWVELTATHSKSINWG